MAFYSFLPPHTDLPKEKLNLVFNKAILIQSLRNYLSTIPPSFHNAFLIIIQIHVFLKTHCKPTPHIFIIIIVSAFLNHRWHFYKLHECIFKIK